MTNAEAVAQGYVAVLTNSGTKTFLKLSDLEAKIASYANGDVITLLTNVACAGATSSNTGTTKMTITVDLSGKTLTLTEGSLLRARNNGIEVNFTLYSSNGKGTLTMADGNTEPIFIAYREGKTIVIRNENGYTDGDVVEINAASLLYLTSRSGKDGSDTTVTFWGGQYNQTAISSYDFVAMLGRSDTSGSVYFAVAVTFNHAKINQNVEDNKAMFRTSFLFSGANTLPTTCATVPGIILNDCIINGYSECSKIHDMETLNSVITYNGCTIKGDISTVGTDTTDVGLGKVILGEGTTFGATDTSFIKDYDASAFEIFDGTTSGVYLAEGAVITQDTAGYKVTKSEE